MIRIVGVVVDIRQYGLARDPLPARPASSPCSSRSSAFGLVLGAVGIYGVTSYTVGRRKPEFGAWIAVGASRRSVIGTAMRGGSPPVVVGALSGLAVSLIATRWLRAYLFQVQLTDPWAFVFVVIIFGSVAALALAIPAWQAGRVDPAEVLGAE